MDNTPASASPRPGTTLWLVVNAASGSNSDESVSELVAHLERAGFPAARTICFPDDDLPDGAALDAAGVGIIAIFAGDGTIHSQVMKVQDWGGFVLVLPGGTQNLLPKAVHGDEADVSDIVARLGAGELVGFCRPAVRTSAGFALVEVVAGPGATWAEVREGVRDMDIPTIASALGEAVRETAVGAPVHVDVPPLGRRSGYRALRVDAHRGTLTVDAYDAQDIADVARHAASMLLRQDFRNGPHEELGSAPRIVCRSDAPIPLMLDGELYEGGTEETFEAASLPVTFLGHPDCASRDGSSGGT